MSRKNLLIAILALVGLSITSCEDDKKETGTGNVEVSVVLKTDSGFVHIGDTAYLNNGYKLHLALFRLYLSNVTLLGNGTSNIKEDVILLSPGKLGDNQFTFSNNLGTFSGLQVGFGLDATQNDSDPISFDNTHPLASYQGMYWDMLKYRFAKFEGMAIETSTGNQSLVAYHPGRDSIYQTKVFNLPFNLNQANQTKEFELHIDLNKIFNGPAGIIDLATENQTHSNPGSDMEIARKFMINLAAAATLISKS